MMRRNLSQDQGVSLAELLVALAIAALLLSGLAGVAGQISKTHDAVRDKNNLAQQANFAMAQMVRAVRGSSLLLLPQVDNPSTNWPENLREQTVPPTPPVGDSTLATAVLAVTVPRAQDLDADGYADGDNDRDGRIDEDLPADSQNDSASGIYGIDDSGDGEVDEDNVNDDDESGSATDEDPVNGLDDDADDSVDEDPSADMNGDGCPGVCGVDDDNDGTVDEGSSDDDDEDGQTDEDGYDALVFYLNNGVLMQRTPVPWDEDGDSAIDGRDFIESALAENVSRFRVERLPLGAGRSVVVVLTLELTDPATGEVVSLNTQARIGGAL